MLQSCWRQFTSKKVRAAGINCSHTTVQNLCLKDDTVCAFGDITMGCGCSREPRLHELAKTGNHSELMQEILRFPDLINEKNAFGKAPIHIACEFNQPEIVKILVNSGAKKDLTTGVSIASTPLHVCAEYGCKDAALVLINMNADINAQDIYGWTPLHYACDKRHPETALMLIEKGADVNAVNNSKETPLHFAAKSGLSGVGEVLIQRKANVNAMDADVWTPLHTACKWNRLEMAVLLARNGADLNAVDETNNNPLEYSPTAKLTKAVQEAAASRMR